MLVAELYDLACAIAELPVDPVLFKAALKSASDNAGLRDVRLRQASFADVNVALGASTVVLPGAVNKLGLIGLRLVHDAREYAIGRVQRAGVYRQQTRPVLTALGQFAEPWRYTDENRYGAAVASLYSWDQPSLAGDLTLLPSAREALVVRVIYEPTYNADDVDAPDWLLYGALEWLSQMVWQDSRQAGWSKAWGDALDAASKRFSETVPRKRFLGG